VLYTCREENEQGTEGNHPVEYSNISRLYRRMNHSNTRAISYYRSINPLHNRLDRNRTCCCLLHPHRIQQPPALLLSFINNATVLCPQRSLASRIQSQEPSASIVSFAPSSLELFEKSLLVELHQQVLSLIHDGCLSCIQHAEVSLVCARCCSCISSCPLLLSWPGEEQILSHCLCFHVVSLYFPCSSYHIYRYRKFRKNVTNRHQNQNSMRA
jgi:hypothetical protein